MNSENIVNSIKAVITKRAISRVDFGFLKKCNVGKIIMAGNSLNASSPHDIDLYPCGTIDDRVNFVNINFDKIDKCEVLHRSKNAITVKYDGTVYQFCNYQKETLEHLVDSFDFSHIQVGVMIDVENTQVSQVYFTDDYVAAQLTGNSNYTGSEYPLSSIIRTLKYYKYGQISMVNAKTSIVNAISDFISRGFSDYGDFKNQLDSIDLLLLKEIDNNAALNLFETCCKANLVLKPTLPAEEK